MKHNHTIYRHRCHFGWSDANTPAVKIAQDELHPLDFGKVGADLHRV